MGAGDSGFRPGDGAGAGAPCRVPARCVRVLRGGANRATWECASPVAGEYATRATGEYATRAVLLGARCDVLDQRARRDGRVGYYGARGVVESSGQGALERSRVSG